MNSSKNKGSWLSTKLAQEVHRVFCIKRWEGDEKRLLHLGFRDWTENQRNFNTNFHRAYFPCSSLNMLSVESSSWILCPLVWPTHWQPYKECKEFQFFHQYHKFFSKAVVLKIGFEPYLLSVSLLTYPELFSSWGDLWNDPCQGLYWQIHMFTTESIHCWRIKSTSK